MLLHNFEDTKDFQTNIDTKIVKNILKAIDCLKENRDSELDNNN